MNEPCEASPALEYIRLIVAQCRDACRRVIGDSHPRAIRSVGVVGAGIMGTAIAIEHAARSIPVVLLDKDADALRRAQEAAAADLAVAGRCGPGSQPASIIFAQDAEELAGCDLVVESIVEKRAAKQSLYAQLLAKLAPEAILATNTSTIPIARLAAGMANSGRFCGLHFCHPVRVRPLVEVIAGPATTPGTMACMIALVQSLGKLPLVVGDGPGFVVNRLLMTYLNEALAMVAAGLAIEKIDSAMIEYGMPYGPLEMLDEIGLDTALQSGVVLDEIFGQRSAGSELLVRLVKARQLGIKSGAGFYCYRDKKRCVNPLVEGIIPESEKRSKDPGDGWGIVSGLLRPMIAEAATVQAEGKVAAAWQTDLAVLFGLGFPLWRGCISGGWGISP